MPGEEKDSGDPVFEALWSRVLEAWDDEKTHAALLEHAIREQRLPDAAGRYRALKDDATKGERARKKLDAIVIAATQMLMAMKTPARVKVPWQITLSAVLVCLFLLAWLGLAIFRHR
jgi:hypothetical protein